VLGVNAPGNNKQLFVVDQVGTITAVTLEPTEQLRGPESLTVLDVGPAGADLLVPLGAFGPGSFDERGLLGLAFHPDYRKNGLVYTYTSEPLGSGAADFTTLDDGEARQPNASLSVIRQWRVDKPKKSSSVVDPGSSRVLLRVEQPQFNHNGGAIAFGPDGMFYIALGDGGNEDDQGAGHAEGGNGQDLSEGNVFGKVLRIDPEGSNSANGGYGIPADNPFVGREGSDEIFAYGFRNPFRLSFDTETGDLYAADVGQNDIEEVDIVVSGGNYGWPVKEGTFLFDMNGDGPGFTTSDSPGVPAGLVDPVAQYDHDEGVSVTGGFVYRGNRVKDLRDTYVFADFTASFAGPQGRLFNIDSNGELVELLPASGPVAMFVTGFGQDRKGELYVMGQQGFTPVGATGQVFKLVPVQ
jgi:glucose/arabinose dehydrogenase